MNQLLSATPIMHVLSMTPMLPMLPMLPVLPAFRSLCQIVPADKHPLFVGRFQLLIIRYASLHERFNFESLSVAPV